MNMTYEVMYRGKKVGTVQLQKQGLYYHLRCSCSKISRDIYRLLVRCKQEKIRCGVLIPEEKHLILETKIPAKKLHVDDLEFWLENIASCTNDLSKENEKSKYIPVYPDEPFTYLARLKNSYYEVRNGNPGIFITD